MSNQNTEYQLTDKALTVLSEPSWTDFPPVGARVHVGNGKKVWMVSEYWTGNNGATLATLAQVDGYANTTVDADRLWRAEQ